MIADRPYMRDTYNPPRYTTVLIIGLIVAFVVQSILAFYGGFNSYKWLGLSVEGLKEGRIWQLFTFQFMHSVPWPWHVLMNCLGLYFFGRTVEETLGSRKFLTLYFLAGVLGGIVQVLTTAVLPKHEDLPVVGASAGVCGILAIFCSLYPMREVTTWIYFFPVTVRARYILMFVGLYSLFGTIIPLGSVAHGAHLGGVLLGMAYVRWFHERAEAGTSFWRRLIPHRRSKPIIKVRFPKASAAARPVRGSKPPANGDAEFIALEVDPILEKISAHGIHSLTEHERKILEAARLKIEKK